MGSTLRSPDEALSLRSLAFPYADIVDVRPRLILTFVGSLMAVAHGH